MKGFSAFTKTDPPKTKKPKTKKKETRLGRTWRGFGPYREQLLEEQRKQREALKKYEEKYG